MAKITRLGKGKYYYEGVLKTAPGGYEPGGIYTGKELFKGLKETKKSRKKMGLKFRPSFKLFKKR